jgi:hypothetical protein
LLYCVTASVNTRSPTKWCSSCGSVVSDTLKMDISVLWVWCSVDWLQVTVALEEPVGSLFKV